MPLNRLFAPLLTAVMPHSGLRNLQRSWFDVKRHLLPSLHRIIYYHRVNDPYCLLMLQALPELLNHFDVPLQIKITFDLPPEANDNRPLKDQYALTDAKQLAQFHQLQFPDNARQPSDKDSFLATSILLKYQHRPKLLHLTNEVTNALWGCSSTTFESVIKRYGALGTTEAQNLMERTCQDLASRGHYNSAMLYYGGEWYWGLDRLSHLAERLNKPGSKANQQVIARYQQQYQHVAQGYNRLRPRPKQVKPLDFYFSFHCPYSYLAAKRLFKLAELYKIPVILKPVQLPQERGISLSRARQTYVFKDAQQEAEKLHIPFARFCEPLGNDTQQCMALFLYAQQQGTEKELVDAALTTIWGKGRDINRAQLQQIAIEAKISDQQMEQALINKDWEKMISRNQQELTRFGLWGTPSFKYGNLVLWGQDRLWALEQQVLAGNDDHRYSVF